VRKIIFIDKQKVILDEIGVGKNIDSNTISGETVISIISPGTELARYKDTTYPHEPGYAAIFKAERIGNNIKGIEYGDLIFCHGNHQSYQFADKDCYIKVPKTFDLFDAIFVRFVKIFDDINEDFYVDKIHILGRGLIASLGRKMYAANIVPLNEAKIILDCTGKEENILKAPRNSIYYLIGVPWEKTSDIMAQEVLKYIFYNKITVRSGWEKDEFNYTPTYFYNIIQNIDFKDIYKVVKPEDCQEVYQELLNNRQKLTAIFDWRK